MDKLYEFILNSDAIEQIFYTKKELITSIKTKKGYQYRHFKAITGIIQQPSEFNLQRAIATLLPEFKKTHAPYRHCEVVIDGRRGLNKNQVGKAIQDLFKLPINSLYDVCDFHIRYEHIHPIQDGNGRTGRMLLASHLIKLEKEGIGKGLVTIKEVDKYKYYDFIKYNSIEDFVKYLE